MKHVTRLDRIRAALKKFGPMTVIQISEVTGFSSSNVAAIVYEFRSNPGRHMQIRKAGKSREDGTMPRTVFELSNEPDAEECSPPSKKNAPRLSREEMAERRQLKEMAKKIQPFRHWQDVAFFGETSHALRT
jgi:hypothetical protein